MSEINYTIKKSKRAKYLRLAIYPDASVVLTVPWWTPKFLYKKFIRDKEPWVLEKLKINHSAGSGQGSKVRIRTRKDYLENKEKARELVLDRLECLNKLYGFCYNRVSIRDQKTRWGSCSSKSNLNFSYKLLFLEKEEADYIIVHEICHLKEMNHSKRFWRLVERVVPRHKEIRKKLRNKGMNPQSS